MGKKAVELKLILVISLLASSAMAQEYVPGEFIIKLKGKASSSLTAEFMGKMQNKMDLKMSLSGMNVHKVALKTGEGFQETLQMLKADPQVEYAEPNYILRKTDSEMDVGGQYTSSEIFNINQDAGTRFIQNYANVGVDSGWTASTTLAANSDRPIVAVIDSGVDYNHEFSELGRHVDQ